MASDPGSKTLYLVDGTAQLFRAYFAVRGLTTRSGLPTNAVFGFTTMLRKLIRDEQPAYLAVAFDAPGPVFRHETYPEYKAHRPPAPEDLNVQTPYARQVCEVLGVAVLERAGFEADDLIATYARLGREGGHDVVVVAADKDLLQLVDDRLTVLNPAKELRLDAAAVARTFGAPPERVRDVLGLMGDSVDNIPGVPGVGEKTAVSLVSMYGDLDDVITRAARFVELYDARDALLEAVDRVQRSDSVESRTAADLVTAARRFRERLQALLDAEPDGGAVERLEPVRRAFEEQDWPAARDLAGRAGSAAAKPLRPFRRQLKEMDRGSSKRAWYAIHRNAEQARLSKRLATLADDAPAERELEDLRLRPPDPERASALFRSLEFQALIEEFGAEEPGDSSPAPAGEAQPGLRYETVLSEPALRDVISRCRAAGRVAVDTETDARDPLRARLVGVALAWESPGGVYVPLGHDYLGAPEQLPLERVARELGPLLADAGVAKVGQNLKYDAHVLRRHGMPVRGWALDTMVAAFLLDPGRPTYSMDSLAREFLGYAPTPYSELAGTGSQRKTLNAVDVERVAAYAAEDAEVTLRLSGLLGDRLEQSGLAGLYGKIDGPLLPVLERMEAHGILVDVELLGAMSVEMESSLAALRGEIHGLAGVEFNVDSPKQLREVLFERLGLKSRRRTAKSKVASTDAQTLEELAGEHAIAKKIIDYRELAKLKGTYVDALPRLVHPESGRVHTCFQPTGAATGRLSSSDPNLQNIPARTAAGLRIRSAFVPEPGYRFLASDYSQVELRVLAHLAGDEEMITAFRAGEDIHRYTASRVFGTAPDLVTDAMRRSAKAVNFGILYGMSETRLAREQGMKREEARRFIRTYFERFARVRAYIDQVRESALRDGSVRTLFGRVRHFPQLHQKVHRGVQEQALRAAVNTTIQGTAADLMKMAMLRVEQALEEAGLAARILLQVHDELLLEVPEAQAEAASRVVRDAMEHVHSLAVPLAVDQKTGQSWLEVT